MSASRRAQGQNRREVELQPRADHPLQTADQVRRWKELLPVPALRQQGPQDEIRASLQTG